MRRFLPPTRRNPALKAYRRLRSGAATGFLLALVACAGVAPGNSDWDASQLARREQRVADGVIGRRDSDAESALRAEICRIDPAVCDAIRVYVVDRPEAQARLWPNDMLIVTAGLLRLIDAGGSEADAMRRFAFAHELAHRQLGHFARRGHRGWNADTAEHEADAHAIDLLRTSGLPTGAGIRLLQAIIDQRGEDSRGAAQLRDRITAMRDP